METHSSLYAASFEKAIYKYRTRFIGKKPAIRAVRTKASEFFKSRIFLNCYRGILLSPIKKVLDAVNKIIAKTYVRDVYWDASHSTMPTLHYHKLIGAF